MTYKLVYIYISFIEAKQSRDMTSHLISYKQSKIIDKHLLVRKTLYKIVILRDDIMSQKFIVGLV